MSRMLSVLFCLAALTVAAAPAAKQDPVAEGFPVWKGVTDKNHLYGREISASDLRHRITVVVEVEASANGANQIVSLPALFSMNRLRMPTSFSGNIAPDYLPRDEIYLISVRGTFKNLKALIGTTLTPKNLSREDKALFATIASPCVPVYQNVAMETEVNAEAKYPFVYVMPPSGKEPVYKGEFDDAGIRKAIAAIKAERKKAKKEAVEWDPFMGSVPAEKCPAPLAKALEKGKTAKLCPMTPVSKALLREVLSKDAEKAANAQIAFDAIEQTRGDLAMRVHFDAVANLERILYDSRQLLKYWPMDRKKIEEPMMRLKLPDATKVAQEFCKMKVWDDPDFTCKNAGEANRIVGELKKSKKLLDKVRGVSKIDDVRNAAMLVDMMADQLIDSIPTRIAVKEETPAKAGK